MNQRQEEVLAGFIWFGLAGSPTYFLASGGKYGFSQLELTIVIGVVGFAFGYIGTMLGDS